MKPCHWESRSRHLRQDSGLDELKYGSLTPDQVLCVLMEQRPQNCLLYIEWLIVADILWSYVLLISINLRIKCPIEIEEGCWDSAEEDCFSRYNEM